MGKYIAYAFKTMQDGQLTVRTDTFVSTVLLCVASVVVHIIWLNKGLEKHDAYFCIIVYQTAWFIFTTVSGVVVYNDMGVMTDIEKIIFVVGLITALHGVKRVSQIHKESPQVAEEEYTPL